MKKTVFKIILIFLLLGYFGISDASIFDIEDNYSEVADYSIDAPRNSDIGAGTVEFGTSVLGTFKFILQAVIMLFLVYAGINMVMSMGSDEEKLSTSKRQIWYSVVGLLFINIPGTLYDVFKDNGEIHEGVITNDQFNADAGGGNLFINDGNFEATIMDGVVVFMEVLIAGIAAIIIIIAGLQIMMARGRDEKISESKTKIIYGIAALFFVGFIEGIKRLAFDGKVATDGTDLFSAGANLVLLFAGPTAIFFVTLAAFYYITSNGDEEKVKKAKAIIINTFLATLILLAAYTFLLDLKTV